MKKLVALALIGGWLFSCSGGEQSVKELIATGELDAIKTKRKELISQQKNLETQLKQLDSMIDVSENGAKIPLVTTLTLEKQSFKHYLELQGDVQTKKNLLLFPEMGGTLERVYVKEGDRVRQGQILGRIDDGGMGSQLAQLKTQAELAKTTFERQERLWKENIGSEIQYLQAKTNYEAMQNSVSQAQSQLAKSILRAPFSGIIDEVIQEEGSTVNPATGQPVFRLVNLSEMYVEVDIPERYLSSVKAGKEVEIFIPVLGENLVSRIRQTGNFINPVNRSFKAEIAVPNKDGAIKPNLTTKVRINDYTSNEALIIPPSVISENADGEQYVYVADNLTENSRATAVKRVIKTGLVQGEFVEILAGLSEGEQVVSEGARRVREGQEIEITTFTLEDNSQITSGDE